LFAAAAWPVNWIKELTKRLLLARGLSSKTKPSNLQSVFPGAEAIVVTQDVTLFGKIREKAVKRGDDG